MKNGKTIDITSSEPLYKQLSNILMSEIASGNYKPNDKFYTQDELKDKYRISVATAREALNELAYRGLIYRIPQRGTFIKSTNLYNKAMDTSISENAIMLITPSWLEMPSEHPSFFADIYKMLETKLLKNGYYIDLFPLSNYKEKEKIIYMKVAQKKMGGIIIVGVDVPKELITNIANTGIPAILLACPAVDERIPAIALDNVGGAFKAVKHLVEKGHRKIGFVGTGLPNRNIVERLDGYKKALKGFNIPVEDKFIATMEPDTKEQGYSCMEMLFKSGELPTAIFAANDFFAAGAMRCIYDRGLRVPEDISVIGYDDVYEYIKTRPPLSSIRTDKERIASDAASMLLGLIKGETNVRGNILTKTKLVERESVKDLTKQEHRKTS